MATKSNEDRKPLQFLRIDGLGLVMLLTDGQAKELKWHVRPLPLEFDIEPRVERGEGFVKNFYFLSEGFEYIEVFIDEENN